MGVVVVLNFLVAYLDGGIHLETEGNQYELDIRGCVVLLYLPAELDRGEDVAAGQE